MSIVIKILSIVGIVILVIIVILILLLIVPFCYFISVSYNNSEISFDFKYFIITFNAFIALKSKIKYYLKIFGVTVFDSDNDKKDKDKSLNKKKIKSDKSIANEANVIRSLSDTDFMNDKSINEKVRASREEAKKLLKSAKKFEKEQLEKMVKSSTIESKRLEKKVDSFIEGLTNIIPPDMKYVLKKTSTEVFKLIKKLAPIDVNVDISYGSSDPYMMGVSYAVLAPLISITGGDINAKPKFGSEEIKADVKLARNVPLITIAIPVVRLILDKKFRNIVFAKK